MRRRAGRPGDQEDAAGVLVEPVNQLGSLFILPRQPAEQAVEMLAGLGPALRRQARRLVEQKPVATVIDLHRLDQLGLLIGQFDQRAPGAKFFLVLGLGGGNADRLARFDPVARRSALAVDPDLAGACPARHLVEADIGQVPLEPAVEADAVIIVRDDEIA